jgi:anti-repressor protein
VGVFIFIDMDELIRVTEKNGLQLISARELHLFLDIETKFYDWCKRMFEYGFIENTDYSKISIDNQQVDYALGLDCAKEIAMIQRNEKGKIARQYFIEVEKKYKQNNLPASYLDALKALVASEEQKQLIEARNLELEPKAEVYDKLSNGINLLTFNDAAKSLGYGRNTLMKILRDRMILRHNNTPYQRYIDSEYFEVKITPISIGQFLKNQNQTYVTAKGLIWLSKTI